MKTQLLSAAFFAASLTTFAQIGVRTTNPQAALDAVPTTTDVVSPRVATIGAIAKPIDGMQAYAIDQKCFKVYQNGAWKDTTPCTAISTDMTTASRELNNGVSSANSAVNTNVTTTDDKQTNKQK